MHACYTHVYDGTGPQRPGCATPQVESARRSRGNVAVRIHSRRAEALARAAHASRVSGKAVAAQPCKAEDKSCGRDPSRARQQVIVLDASAVIALLLGTDGADAVRVAIKRDTQTLHAPHLLDVEVGQVLRRYCMFEGLAPGRGEVALQDLLALDIHRYSHEALLARIWELRGNLTAYDAAYIALAEVLDAPLLTLDGRLARASGHMAKVTVIS